MPALPLLLCVLAASPEPPPVLGEPPPPAEAPDAGASAPRDDALLQGLLTLTSPGNPSARAQAAAELGATGDARAVGPLQYVLADPTVAVRKAAVTALGSFRDPRAESALRGVATRSGEAVEVRLAAISGLARVASPASGEALYSLYVDTDQPGAVREGARAALAESYPSLLQTRPGPSAPPGYAGRVLLGAAGAAFGAFTLATVGAFGQADVGIPLGILGGVPVGAATGALLGGETTVPQALYYGAGLLWGTANGLGIAAATLPSDTPGRWYAGLGVLGEGAGLGLTLLTWKYTDYEVADVLLVELAGLTGASLAVGGLLCLTPNGNLQPAFGITTASADVGLGAMAALTRRLHFTNGDAPLTALAGALGAWDGLWLGAIAAEQAGPDARNNPTLGGFFLGAGLGLTLGIAAAQVSDFTPGDVGAAGFADAFGTAAGAGLSLALPGKSTVTDVAAAHLAVGTAGLVGALALSDRLHFSPGGSALTALSSGVGFEQGLTLGVYLASGEHPAFTGNQAIGLTLLGTGAGGLAGMGLAQVLSPGALQVACWAGGAFWGAYLAFWAALYGQASTGAVALITAGVSDLALAGSILLTTRLGAPPLAFGLASLGGVVGASLVSLGTALFTGLGRHLMLANLIGATVGLAAGAYAGVALAPAFEARYGAQAGLALPALPRALRSVRVVSAGPTPLVAPGQTSPSGAALVVTLRGE